MADREGFVNYINAHYGQKGANKMVTRSSKASTRPAQLKPGQVPVDTTGMADVEIADAQRASATADATNKEGETSNRLPYKLLTSEAMEHVRAVAPWLTRPDTFGPYFEAPARAFGASLPVEQVRRIVHFDPAFDGEVVCTGRKGACGFRFRPLAIVAPRNIGEDGKLKVDERLVNESNPEGIEYAGSVLVVKTDPLARYSKSATTEPRCLKCVKGTQATAWENGNGYRPKALPKHDAEALVASINASRDAGKARHLAQRDEYAADLNLTDENGQRRERKGGFHKGPRLTQTGQRGRQRDPREYAIGNRGPDSQ